MLIQIALGAVFSIGLWLLYSTSFVEPTRRSLAAVSKNKAYGLTRKYENLLSLLTEKAKPFVRLSEFKHSDYSRMLAVLGMTNTPEDYVARTLVKAVLYFFVGLLTAFISPQFLILAPLFAVIIYIFDLKMLKSKYLQRKTDIELELPKLCNVINSRLQSTSNVPSILSDFIPIANVAMAAELVVTLADIKTGNVETALRRFEGRISSPKVSDVVRGLIAVQNGDDMRVFFQSKQYQFNNDYITVKKKSVLKRPMKLGIPGALAFLFFILIIMYPMVIGMQNYLSDFML